MFTYIFAATLLFFGSSATCASPNCTASDSCEKEAFLWCSALKHEKLSQEDTIMLLNLTYWSWARSTMILHAQKAVAQYVHDVHELLHTSMAGRMNPARLCSIAGCSTDEWYHALKTYEQAQVQLVEKLKAYRYACATYAQCLEYILKSEHASPVVVRYAQSLREHARTSLLETLKKQALSVNKAMETLGKVFECVRFGGSTRSISSSATRGVSTRSFFDIVLNFADLGLFNSFSKFDKKYLQCNDVMWSSLAKSYALGNIIWDISEGARADFYKIHHRMLMRALCDDNVKAEIATAFGPDGFIAPNMRKQCISRV